MLHEIMTKTLPRTDMKTSLDFFRRGFELSNDDRLRYFDIDKTPWLRVLCRWLDDPKINWIYLICGSQLAKTTFMLGALLYVSQYVYGAVPALWVGENRSEAFEFAQKRLKPFLHGNINIDNFSQSYVTVHNASLKIGWGTNKSSLRGRPTRFIFGDEVCTWKEHLVYTKKRTRVFGSDAKGIYASTPPDNPYNENYEAMVRAPFFDWQVKCPECGKKQTLQWKQLRFDIKNITEVYFLCRKCKTKIPESRKKELIKEGEAVAVNPDTYEEQEYSLAGNERTLHVSGLLSLFASWADRAKEFRKAKKSSKKALMTFITDELGESPKQIDQGSSIQIEQQYLKKFIKPLHDEYMYHTIGIDVQKEDVYAVVLGWHKSDSKELIADIIENANIPWKVNQETNWNLLAKFLQKYSQSRYFVGIDATDGTRCDEIYKMTREKGRKFFPIKDRGKIMSRSKYSKTLDFKEVKDKRVKVLWVSSAAIKDEISQIFNRSPFSENAWIFSRDLDDAFYRHLTNEYRVSDAPVSRWETKYHHAPYHYFSALVYAYAISSFVKITRPKSRFSTNF